jgi:Flp pilus assembly protein TadG
MRNLTRVSDALSRRRGVALVYVIATMTVMLAFCSLAVDFGRVQVAKTELRRAADAAARAGAAYLNANDPNETYDVDTAAENIAAKNKVDGTPLTLGSGNILIGSWNTSTLTFTQGGSTDNVTTFNAVEIVVQRSAANGNPIPLLFGSILGVKSCDVTATSIASLIAVEAPQHVYVSAHGNPWLAGEPAGTKGSVNDPGYSSKSHPYKYDVANPTAVASAESSYQDGSSYTAPTDSTQVEPTDYTGNEPYASPSEFMVSTQPGTVIQVSIPEDSDNVATNHGYLTGDSPSYYATGSNSGSYAYYSDDAANPSLSQGTQTTSGSEHGISNIIAPINSVVGVFLNKDGATDGADNQNAPTGTDYSVEANRDNLNPAPKRNQTFYVGDGESSSGQQESIVVPANSYALFLGTMDGHEWSNNVGGFHATITQLRIELVQ